MHEVTIINKSKVCTLAAVIVRVGKHLNGDPEAFNYKGKPFLKVSFDAKKNTFTVSDVDRTG